MQGVVIHVDVGYQIPMLATVTRYDIQGPYLAYWRVIQVAMVRGFICLRG